MKFTISYQTTLKDLNKALTIKRSTKFHAKLKTSLE